MFKNYLKIALRNIRKNKVATFINILGLFIGISCCLVIYSKIRYETSFDTFHSDYDRIYRKVRITSGLDYLRGKLEYRAGTFWAFPFSIRNEIPEVELVTPVFKIADITIGIPEDEGTKDKLFQEEDGLAFVEPEFFELFDFKKKPLTWIYGDPETSLRQAYSVVLSKTLANKYYPNQNPLGKNITVMGVKGSKITGVVEDLPSNTNFPFSMFVSYSTWTAMRPGIETQWSGLADFHHCYMKLKPGVSTQEIEAKFKEMHGRHTNTNMLEERLFKLQPLTEVHTDENFRGHNFNNSFFSDKVKLTMILIAVFLVIILSINYNNLSISISATRSKEVAVRKISGSTKRYIMLQFFGESFVLTFLAMLLSLGVSAIVLTKFSAFFGLPLGLGLVLDGTTILLIVFLLLVLSLFSGGYPALIVSRLKPVAVLRKGTTAIFSGKQSFSVSSLLVQFVIAQVMIIAALSIYKQLHFINTTDLGYQREGIIALDLGSRDRIKAHRFKAMLEQNPKISQCCLGSTIPAISSSFMDIRYSGPDEIKESLAVTKIIDSDYLSTYGLKLLYGRNLEESDSFKNVVVNEELLHELELPVSSESLGEYFSYYRNRKAEIVGIVKDFHANSFHENIRPAALFYNPYGFRSSGIRFNMPELGNNNFQFLSELISEVEECWNSVYSNDESIFQYVFLDDYIAQYYEDEKHFGQIVNLFTVLIILICCMGIVGLSYYTIKRKNKEIAVRKVNGARIGNILGIFSADYVKLVFISFIVSVPLSYFALSKWLQHFAYKTELSWWLFVIAGVMASLVALFTISIQSWNAANKNPIEAIRYE